MRPTGQAVDDSARHQAYSVDGHPQGFGGHGDWGGTSQAGRDDQNNRQDDSAAARLGTTNPSLDGAGARLTAALTAPKDQAKPETAAMLVVETGYDERRAGLAAPMPWLPVLGEIKPRWSRQARAVGTAATAPTTPIGAVRRRLDGVAHTGNQVALRAKLFADLSPLNLRYTSNSLEARNDQLATGNKTGSHASRRYQPGRDHRHPWITRYDATGEPSLGWNFISVAKKLWPGQDDKRWNALTGSISISRKNRRITEVSESLDARAHRARCRAELASSAHAAAAPWYAGIKAFFINWFAAHDSYDHQGRIIFWAQRLWQRILLGHTARSAASAFRLFTPQTDFAMRFEQHRGHPWAIRLWFTLADAIDCNLQAYVEDQFGFILPDWCNFTAAPELAGHKSRMERASFEEVNTERRRGLQLNTRIQETEEYSGGLAGQSITGAVGLQGRARMRSLRGVDCTSLFVEDCRPRRDARLANAELVAALKNPTNPLRLPQALVAAELDAHGAIAWLQALKQAGRTGSLFNADSRLDEAVRIYSATEYEVSAEPWSVLREWSQGRRPRRCVIVREEKGFTLAPQADGAIACVSEQTHFSRNETYERLDLPWVHNSAYTVQATWSPPGKGQKRLEQVCIDLDLVFADAQGHTKMNKLLQEYPKFFSVTDQPNARKTTIPALPEHVPIGDRIIQLSAKIPADAFASLCQRLVADASLPVPLTPAQRSELGNSEDPELQVAAFARYICHRDKPHASLEVLCGLHEGPFFSLSGKSKSPGHKALNAEFHSLRNDLLAEQMPPGADAYAHLEQCAQRIAALQEKIIAAQALLPFDCLLTPSQKADSNGGFNVILEDLHSCLHEQMTELVGSDQALIEYILQHDAITPARAILLHAIDGAKTLLENFEITPKGLSRQAEVQRCKDELHSPVAGRKVKAASSDKAITRQSMLTHSRSLPDLSEAHIDAPAHPSSADL